MSIKLQRDVVPAIPFVDNQVKQEDIPRDFLFEDLMLEFTGDLVVTGAVTLRSEPLANLIRQLDLVGDGETIQTWPGRMLRAFNYFMKSRLCVESNPATGIGTNPFVQTFFLPFNLMRTGNPFITIFDPTRFKNLVLRTTWGTATDAFSAGTATVATTSALNIYPKELEARPSMVIPSGSQRPQVLRTQHVIEDIASANTRHSPRNRSICWDT